jgi:D-3-phosphoglycerate dehydrogenase / 2-oxoglutarate reductase
VDEAALARALETGQIATAGLDVFEDEPLAMESPLRRLGDRVLLSPHMISSNVGSGLRPGIEWSMRSVLSALRGEVPDNVFNADVIWRWQQRFGGRSVFDPQGIDVHRHPPACIRHRPAADPTDGIRFTRAGFRS